MRQTSLTVAGKRTEWGSTELEATRGLDLRSAVVDCRSVTAWDGTNESSDVALVCAAQDGDTGAFGLLYSRYAKMVHGILLARVPSTEIDDLVQEVFLRAFPRLRSLRDAARFGGWLAAIARNRANDYHRKTRSAGSPANVMAGDDVEVLQAAPSETLSGERVLELIRSLPEAYRETLILRLVEGLTGPEIAARTGLTPGSVRVNLHRGMQQLREKLGNPAGQTAPDFRAHGSLSARWKYVMRKRNAP
jgi:RNA polymerase sigma-70 factor, ECF subfamily